MMQPLRWLQRMFNFFHNTAKDNLYMMRQKQQKRLRNMKKKNIRSHSKRSNYTLLGVGIN